MQTVPNLFPIHDSPSRIAIIGEAPGDDELLQGKPFVGQAGQLLYRLLEQVGIDKDACFIGNVCQHPGDINRLTWDGAEMEAGKSQLALDLAKHKPNICILLGNTPLRHFANGRRPINKWRGTLFKGLADYKCISTFHPASLLPNKQPQNKVWAIWDLQRALVESISAKLALPQRSIYIYTNFEEALGVLQLLNRPSTGKLAFDIEGTCRGMTCFAFSNDPDTAKVFPLYRQDGTALYTAEEEAELLTALRQICMDKPLILHNALYDAFVLAYTYGILLENIVDDTMIQWWELHSELEKGLDDISSYLTREPYFKAERHTTDDQTAWKYNGKDACVTYECNQKMDTMLDDAQIKHYKFNIALLYPVLYMALRGISIDNEKQTTLQIECKAKALTLQHKLNLAANKGIPETHEERIQLLRQRLCLKTPRKHTLELIPLKRNRKAKPDKPDWYSTHRQVKRTVTPTINKASDIIIYSKPSQITIATKAVAELLGKTSPSSTSLAQWSIDLDCHLNVNSPKFNDWLYIDQKFPKQFIKEGGRNTTRLCHNAQALLSIFLTTKNPLVKLCLELVSQQTQLETLIKGSCDDGRIRTSLNLVGTESGRFNSSRSACGNGFNLQTVTKKHRVYFTADPGYEIAELDLEGADGWTIAAHCLGLGDDALWNDLQAGLKPANIITLCHEHGQEVNEWDTDKLKEMSKTVDKDGWLYKACKMTFYGSCYLMGEKTMSAQILTQSYKQSGTPTYVKPSTCKQIQRQIVFSRYPGLQLWHRFIGHKLLTQTSLTSASGHSRIFFGPHRNVYGDVDHRTLGTALANEPQESTTYATKLALFRLWYDPANHNTNGSLKVEPLLTVHDSLLVQWRISDRAEALTLTKQWFDNTIPIAGKDVLIPFSGSYGKNWAMKKGESVDI